MASYEGQFELWDAINAFAATGSAVSVARMNAVVQVEQAINAICSDLRTKLAAARAKSEQRREVLREREFNNEETTNYGCHQEWFCGDCGARARIRFEGDKWVHEPHKEFCAWKLAMEDA